MGGGASSSYKMAVGSPPSTDSYPWVASSGDRIALRQESFENVHPIGKGKFGLVFLSRQSNKHVAIKYISKQLIFDLQANRRIQKEMNALQRLKHPFIMHFFGCFEATHSIALVCEFCPGGELFHLLRKRVKFAESEAMFYFCELASVLRYLHEEKQVVYRDLKPENIVIDATGHIKLCDFGFCTESNGEEDDLRDGCGTAMYLAPEIASGFHKFSHGRAVDWWSLGCVLYEMVVGVAPFGDSDHMTKYEIFNNITGKAVHCPLFMNGHLKALIKGLLEKQSEKRFSWNDVVKSPWLREVDWTKVDEKSITPPWTPTVRGVGSVENFLKWDFELPQSLPSSAATTYCAQLQLPKPPVPDALQKRNSSATLSKTASSTLLSKQPSAVLSKHQSSRASLTQQPSAMKLESSKSRAALIGDRDPISQSSPLSISKSNNGRKSLSTTKLVANSLVVPQG